MPKQPFEHKPACPCKTDASKAKKPGRYCTCRSAAPPQRVSSRKSKATSLDTIHLESLITVLDESRSHHILLPLQMKRRGGQWVLSEAAHAVLTDPSRVDLYQGRDPAEKE